MTSCPRPLDPIDAEAVAAGAEPLMAADAAAHAAACPSCGERVRAAEGVSRSLEAVSAALPAIAGLADRVTRLRSFSRRERRTYALWQAPILLDAALVAAGTALLALPALTAAEQVSVGAAALAPLIGLSRSLSAWALEGLRVAPRGLEALSDGLRGQSALGIAALALLIPAGLGLRRVLARVPGRK